MSISRLSNKIEVNLKAIRDNITAVRNLIGPGCGLLAVVKCNAYGHGAVGVASTILDAGAEGLCVAHVDEAEELRLSGIDAPILLMNSTVPKQARDISMHHFVLAIYNREMIEALADAAMRTGYGGSIHLKVDSGMGRLGLTPSEAVEYAKLLKEYDTTVGGFSPLSVEGIFSHLATAEENDESYAREQFQQFSECLREVRKLFPEIKAHIANSAATLKFPEMRLDAVRAGLLVYGIQPTSEPVGDIKLTPALSWKTHVAYSKRIPAGTYVSYSRLWQANKETTLVTLPIGYGDGYMRNLTNTGQVLLRGKLMPVVGRVCMNHIMVDAGDEKDIQTGEEAVLLGRQGENEITAVQLAEWAGTVPHEILSKLNPQIARTYLK